jgi:hypothetical protein
LELRNKVIENIIRTDKNTQIDGKLKDAQRQIVSIAGSSDFGEHDFKSLRTQQTIFTMSTSADVILPSNNRLIISIILDNGSNSKSLIYKSPATFQKLFPKPTLFSGLPSFYTWSTSSKITLDKAADKNYSLIVNYSRWPKPLLTDTDEIELIGLDNIVIDYITYQMYLSMGIEEGGVVNDVVMWKGVFESDLRRVIQEESVIKDWKLMAEGFASTGLSLGEPWKNPFCRG